MIIPLELLKFIPKAWLNNSYGEIVEKIAKVAEVLVNRVREAKKYSDRYKGGAYDQTSAFEAFATILQKTGIIDANQALLNKTLAIRDVITKANKVADLNIDDNADLKEKALYSLANLLKISSSNTLTKFMKLIDEKAADVAFESFETKEPISKEYVDPETGKLKVAKESFLNQLTLIYLTAGESEIREFLRRLNYSTSAINKIIIRVRNNANQEYQRYKPFIQEFEQSSQETKSKYAKFKKAEKEYKESATRTREALIKEYQRFSIIIPPKIKKPRKPSNKK